MTAVSIAFAGVSGWAADRPRVNFGYVNWPGVTVKTAVAKQLLEYLGYEVDLKMLSVPVVFRGLANKDLHLFVSAWLPTMKTIADKYFLDQVSGRPGAGLGQPTGGGEDRGPFGYPRANAGLLDRIIRTD